MWKRHYLGQTQNLISILNCILRTTIYGDRNFSIGEIYQKMQTSGRCHVIWQSMSHVPVAGTSTTSLPEFILEEMIINISEMTSTAIKI